MTDESLPGQGHHSASYHRWCDRFELAPIAVALPMLGILGGICGEPVSVWLRDFPPDVVGAIQRLLVRHLPGDQICEIFGRSDLQRLAREPGRYLLALIDPIRGHQSFELAAQWLISRRRGTRTPGALFGPDDGVHQAPGAILSIRSNPVEIARLRGWLLRESAIDSRVLSFLESCTDSPKVVDFGQLAALIDGSGCHPLWRPRTLRSIETLRGLLAGRALLRRIVRSGDETRAVSPSLDDYKEVRNFLRGISIGAPEEAGDPLMVAMIGRANLYLKLRTEQVKDSEEIKVGRRGNSSRAMAGTPRDIISPERPITLREVADLGNPRSAITRALVGSILGLDDVGAFDAMGLLRPLPAQYSLRGASMEDLVAMLRSWTAKQARSRFDRMRRDGLVDASRQPANGPWVYQIPEEYGQFPGEFQGLPSAEQVRGIPPPP